MVWAADINDEIVGTFWVVDGLKLNPKTTASFLLKQWYKKSASFWKAMTLT